MNPPDLTTPTTLGNWVLLIAQAVDSYGVDSECLFKSAGIDLADIKKNETRFLTSQMTDAWQKSVLKTQDPYIAIRVAKLFKSTSYSALGMAMAASRNVYDAIKRCCRYSHFVSEGTMASLEETDHEVAFVLSANPEFKSLTHIYGISATLCCMYQSFRELSGNSLRVKAIHFEQTFESKKPFENFFSCPVYYGSNSNKMVFDKKQAFTDQVFSNCELSSSLDEWIEGYLTRIRQDRLSNRIKKYFTEHMGHTQLDISDVACHLAMSIRMLQRKLHQEGTTYKQLLNDFKKARAIKLITQHKLPLSQVSLLLGFNDQSNFTRAFKRWTGTTPYKYR